MLTAHTAPCLLLLQWGIVHWVEVKSLWDETGISSCLKPSLHRQLGAAWGRASGNDRRLCNIKIQPSISQVFIDLIQNPVWCPGFTELNERYMMTAETPEALQWLRSPPTEQDAEGWVCLQQSKQDKPFPFVKAMIYAQDYHMPFYSPNPRPRSSSRVRASDHFLQQCH